MVAAFVVYPGSASETNARLLIESIRAFGGVFSNLTLWCLVPTIKMELSKPFRDLLDKAGVQLVLFDVESDVIRFPFAADVVAAQHAEAKANHDFDLLVWLGANTIVFHEPNQFLIPVRKQVGYRPVHHINIGALADQPINPFWTHVYQACRVPPERLFPMETHVDARKIRPYINATSLVIRPGQGLFAAWQDIFFKSYQRPEFTELYRQDEQYAIFMHQAILSGIILTMFRPRDLIQLPNTYNYPLHLWDQDITALRPHRLTDLVTVRHEGFYKDPDWPGKMPEGDGLKQWLAGHILMTRS